MPSDLVCYTYLTRDGQPRVEAGPLLRHGSDLSIFFNEINRARPQVHSLMLRAMAERSVNAFNAEHRFPHLQVFADRNRVERESRRAGVLDSTSSTLVAFNAADAVGSASAAGSW